ncbi:MAG: hypothetical protein ACRCTW_11175 [Lactococcus garvieae]
MADATPIAIISALWSVQGSWSGTSEAAIAVDEQVIKAVISNFLNIINPFSVWFLIGFSYGF